MLRTLLASALVCAVAICGAAAAQADTLHFEGFETDSSWVGYQSELTRVVSGTGGVASAGGGWHLEVADPAALPSGYFSGAYSVLGGYRTGMALNWNSSIDVYIDLEDARIAGGTYGFDLTQAVTDTDGNHEQDMIFHVGAVGGDVYLNASHNSDFAVTTPKITLPQQPYGSTESAGVFSQSGWYTFGWEFGPSTDATHPDHVDVAFSVLDSSGAEFWAASWTTEGVLAAEMGGNRYMWFTFADAETLAIDNVRLNGSVVPEPMTLALFGLGIVGVASRRRRAS